MHCLSVGSVAGFLGFAVVGFLLGDDSGSSDQWGYYLALSAMVGLGGKEPTEVLDIIRKRLTKRLLGPIDDDVS